MNYVDAEPQRVRPVVEPVVTAWTVPDNLMLPMSWGLDVRGRIDDSTEGSLLVRAAIGPLVVAYPRDVIVRHGDGLYDVLSEDQFRMAYTVVEPPDDDDQAIALPFHYDLPK